MHTPIEILNQYLSIARESNFCPATLKAALPSAFPHSAEEQRKIYYKLLLVFHPDKQAQKESRYARPDYVTATQAITTAYNQLPSQSTTEHDSDNTPPPTSTDPVVSSDRPGWAFTHTAPSPASSSGSPHGTQIESIKPWQYGDIDVSKMNPVQLINIIHRDREGLTSQLFNTPDIIQKLIQRLGICRLIAPNKSTHNENYFNHTFAIKLLANSDYTEWIQSSLDKNTGVFWSSQASTNLRECLMGTHESVIHFIANSPRLLPAFFLHSSGLTSRLNGEDLYLLDKHFKSRPNIIDPVFTNEIIKKCLDDYLHARKTMTLNYTELAAIVQQSYIWWGEPKQAALAMVAHDDFIHYGRFSIIELTKRFGDCILQPYFERATKPNLDTATITTLCEISKMARQHFLAKKALEHTLISAAKLQKIPYATWYPHLNEHIVKYRTFIADMCGTSDIDTVLKRYELRDILGVAEGYTCLLSTDYPWHDAWRAVVRDIMVTATNAWFPRESEHRRLAERVIQLFKIILDTDTYGTTAAPGGTLKCFDRYILEAFIQHPNHQDMLNKLRDKFGKLRADSFSFYALHDIEALQILAEADWCDWTTYFGIQTLDYDLHWLGYEGTTKLKQALEVKYKAKLRSLPDSEPTENLHLVRRAQSTPPPNPSTHSPAALLDSPNKNPAHTHLASNVTEQAGPINTTPDNNDQSASPSLVLKPRDSWLLIATSMGIALHYVAVVSPLGPLQPILGWAAHPLFFAACLYLITEHVLEHLFRKINQHNLSSQPTDATEPPENKQFRQDHQHLWRWPYWPYWPYLSSILIFRVGVVVASFYAPGLTVWPPIQPILNSIATPSFQFFMIVMLTMALTDILYKIHRTIDAWHSQTSGHRSTPTQSPLHQHGLSYFLMGLGLSGMALHVAAIHTGWAVLQPMIWLSAPHFLAVMTGCLIQALFMELVVFNLPKFSACLKSFSSSQSMPATSDDPSATIPFTAVPPAPAPSGAPPPATPPQALQQNQKRISQ